MMSQDNFDSLNNPNLIGLGPITIEKLEKLGGITKLSELFYYKDEDLVEISGMALSVIKKVKIQAKNILKDNNVNIYNRGWGSIDRPRPYHAQNYTNTNEFNEYKESFINQNQQTPPKTPKFDCFDKVSAFFNNVFSVTPESSEVLQTTTNLKLFKSRLDKYSKWIELCDYSGFRIPLYLLSTKGFFHYKELVTMGVTRGNYHNILPQLVNLDIIEQAYLDDYEYEYIKSRDGMNEHNLESIKIFRFNDEAKVFFTLPQVFNEIKMLVSQNLKSYVDVESNKYNFFVEKFKAAEKKKFEKEQAAEEIKKEQAQKAKAKEERTQTMREANKVFITARSFIRNFYDRPELVQKHIERKGFNKDESQQISNLYNEAKKISIDKLRPLFDCSESMLPQTFDLILGGNEQ